MLPLLFDLIWLVGPDLPHKADQMPKTKISVEIEEAGKTITLKPQIGDLKPELQSLCHKQRLFAKDEIARIDLEFAGEGGYYVVRTGSMLEIREFGMDDGACEDKKGNPVPCEPGTKHVEDVPLAPDVKLKQKIMRVDAKGHRTPFSCKATD
ncbi:MAG: hypothetical protein QM831_43515 [Kofleriaceae bacterium]